MFSVVWRNKTAHKSGWIRSKVNFDLGNRSRTSKLNLGPLEVSFCGYGNFLGPILAVFELVVSQSHSNAHNRMRIRSKADLDPWNRWSTSDR